MYTPRNIIYTKPVSDIRFPEHFTPSFWKTSYVPSNNAGEFLVDVEDPKTKELYLNDPLYIIRYKFFLLNIATPISYSFLIAGCIIECTIKIFALFAMWCCQYKNEDSINQIPLEIIKLLSAPLILIAAEITVILGLIFPLNARKIFASIERLLINNYDFVYKRAITNKLNTIFDSTKIAKSHEYITIFEEKSSFRDILDTYIIDKSISHSIIENEQAKCEGEINPFGDNPQGFRDLRLVKYHAKQKFILAKCFQPRQEIPAKYSETSDQELGYSISYS